MLFVVLTKNTYSFQLRNVSVKSVFNEVYKIYKMSGVLDIRLLFFGDRL